MAKRLLAMLLTLVMILQPVLPAAAEAAGDGQEVTTVTEETVEATEEVMEEPAEEVTEEVSEEPTEEVAEEATEKPTEGAVEEVTDGTEAAPVESSAPIEENQDSTAEAEQSLTILLPENVTVLRVGDQCTLRAVQAPIPEEALVFSWSSSRPEIATVSELGLFTALSEGETVITVTASGNENILTAELALTVLPENPFQGNGSEEEPYILGTEEDLKLLASLVNSGKAHFADAWYLLGADLALADHIPIGTEEYPFCGHFSGNGYRMTGLTGGDEKYWGLFGVTEGAVLSGIALEEVSFSGTAGTTAGAIVGLLRSSRLEKSYAAGEMSAEGTDCLLGGLVGKTEDSTISDSFIQMTIMGYVYAGGLAAQAASTSFQNCYAVGEIGCSDGDDFDAMAGKVGDSVTFENCYQVDIPGQYGQFLTVKEANFDSFDSLDPEIWTNGPEAYPYPVLAICPYSGIGYTLPDTQEYATGYIQEGSPTNVPQSHSYAKHSGSLPSKYTTPDLPDVRNQNPFGTCWAHGAIAGAEISLIKKGLASSDIDLSEAQLAWFHHKGTKNTSGKYEDPLNNFGGDHNVYVDVYNKSIGTTTAFDGDNYAFADYSLASGIGLMEEDSKTKHTTSNLVSIDQNGLPYAYAFSKDAAVLQNVRHISMDSGTAVIKQAIQDYGCVGISYCDADQFYTSSKKYFYCSKDYTPNHAVVIVGWDDTISKNYFRDSQNGTTPSRNGAWIVRNSWGSSFGNKGYFYMSYDTFHVSDSYYTGYVWDYALADEDAYLYQYDGTESNSFKVVYTDTAEYANVFTAQGDERLEAVSFWVPITADVNYRIDVYTNTTSGAPTSGTLAASAIGKTGLAGYYTVDLNSPVTIPKGTSFSLVVTLSGKSGYYIPVDTSVNYTWTKSVSYAKAGQSYLMQNGSWQDCGSASGFNFRIKGHVTRLKEPIGQPCGDSVTYYITSNGTLTLKGSGDMWRYSPDNPAPWYTQKDQIRKVHIASSGLKMISAYAFYNLKNLKGVQFPDSCNQLMLGDSCFEGSGLESVEIPKKVWLGTSVFKDCKSLTSIRFAEDETSISRSIADGCTSLTSVYIPDGCTYIGAGAFGFCGKLSTVKLPRDLKEIGDSAFSYCSSLQKIDLPTKQLTKIGSYAFERTGIQEIRIPESVVEWGSGGAFQYSALKTAYLPDSMTSIPNYMFNGCESLTTVHFGKNVRSVGSYAFQSTAFSSITLPDTITFVGAGAFRYAQKLKSIVLPAELKYLYGEAFQGCISLEKITLPATLNEIWSTTFVRCNALKEIVFEHDADTALKIKSGAFSVDTPNVATTISVVDANNINPAISGYDWTKSNRVVTYVSNSTPTQSNTITASNITLTADNAKAQTASLNASALGGAALSYQSDNASVTVSSNGTVTVAKGFVGTAKITITAAATSAYKQTTKTITVTVKANAETAATIKVESQNSLTGKSLTVPVMLTKNSGIAGFGLTVKYDTSVLTLNSITVGSAISGNGTFSTNGDITTWYTVDNTTVTGELMQLNFTVKEDAPEGDTEVTVALTDGLDSNLSDEDGNPVSVAITAGKITVTRGILGDVNGDGSVAIADVVLLNRSVLGKVTLTDTARKLGDVNGDGNISIADVVKLNRYVLKKIAVLAASADRTVDGVSDFNAVPASISVGTIDGKAGQTVTVPVSISGNPGIAGYSLKVNYDANVLTLNSMTAGSLISGGGTFSVNDEAHIVNWYTVDNLTGDGELLKLSFTVKEGAAEGTIPVSVSLNDNLDSNLSNEDGMAVPVTFTAGGIRVAKAQSGTFGTLTWKLTDDGTLTISGSGEMDSLSYPWEDYASTVRRLEVQSGVTSIAKSAFSGFEALEEVVLADTVTIIDGSAFSMCGKLSKLDLGSGLRVIYSHAFEFCDSLEEVNLPASASSISPSAFENCGSLQNFHVASGNENYCDAEGVLFWNGKILLAAFPGGRTGSYTVPGSVKTIGNCAFYASKLTEVVLPSGLKTMGDYCFRYSTVSQLTLPAGLENLGVGAFEACRELKTVTVPGSVKTVPESAFSLSGLETVTLEDGITAIEKEAFLSCALTKVTIPSSVTDIGEHAFGYEVNRMDYNKIAGFTIVGLEGSAAQRYADINGFQFEKIPMAIQLDIPDTITAGTSIQLKAQVVPAQYDTGKYTWSLKNSADSAYVTLSGNKLTAKSVPEVLNVTVVCTNGNLQAQRTVTIVPTPAEITVYHEEEPVAGSLAIDLNETSTVTLTAKATPEDAAMELVWTWSDTKGAFGTYSQENGILTVKLNKFANLGTITLTATDQLTKKKATVKLITTRKSFGNITILGAPSTITGGSSLQLDALFSGSPANTKVLWSLDDEDQAYASITPAGKLTAVQVTEAHTITVHAQAADGGSNGVSQIRLVPNVQNLELVLDGKAVEKSAAVYLNDTKDLSLSVNTWPEDASENVTWTVSNNKIATAQTRSDGTLSLSQFTGETGVITVKATAQDGSKKTASVQLKFARRPDSISILDSKGNKISEPITLKGKQSYSFKTEVRTQHGEKLTDKDLVWYVDSDDEGYITLKNGKVSVRSFASSDPVSVFIEARVKSHPETKDRIELKLLPDQASGIYIDDVYNRKRLNDTTYTIDRSKVLFFLRARTVGLPDDTVVWSLAKPTDVVTIEEDGTVWLKKAGTATITAINPASKMKASFKLEVTNKVRKLTVSDAPSVLSGGKKAVLKAETVPVNPTNAKLTWFLLDNSGGAASITPAGVLTASKVTGIHTVKVAVMTENGRDISEPAEIRIIPAASRVAISGTPHNNIVDLNTCSSLKLTARVYPSESSQEVTWTSSNKAVQVDAGGNVTILSGIKPGSVTLTAIAADGSGKKAAVKLNLVRYTTSISMVNSAAVTGGKVLKLTATPDKLSTSKKLVWSMTGDTAYCTLSNGSLKTKAVTSAKYVTIRATAADGSGVYAECDVTILPK